MPRRSDSPSGPRDTESAWKKLATVDYGWVYIAYAIRPERVKHACRVDKSIAIAHGLEALYVEKEEKKKKALSKEKSGGMVELDGFNETE